MSYLKSLNALSWLGNFSLKYSFWINCNSHYERINYEDTMAFEWNYEDSYDYNIAYC